MLYNISVHRYHYTYTGITIRIQVPLYVHRYHYPYTGTTIRTQVPLYVHRYHYTYTGTTIYTYTGTTIYTYSRTQVPLYIRTQVPLYIRTQVPLYVYRYHYTYTDTTIPYRYHFTLQIPLYVYMQVPLRYFSTCLVLLTNCQASHSGTVNFYFCVQISPHPFISLSTIPSYKTRSKHDQGIQVQSELNILFFSNRTTVKLIFN